MGNETTGRIMPIYSDMLLNSEDPKVLILPASVDKAIIVTTKNNKRLDEVLEELERSGGTIKSIELNGDTVAIGENGTVNLGNLLSGESLKTINNEGLVGNTNINLINAVFGKYGTEGNVTTFLVPRINDNTEAFVPATASEHTLYIDVYNNKIYRYVDNEYVVALDTSGFALKTELDEKANASDVVKSISVNGTAQTKDAQGNVAIAGLVTTSQMNTALNDVPTKTEMSDAIDNAVSEAQVTVVPAENVGLINGLGSDSTTDGLTANMGKVIKAAILTLFGSLGNYCFPAGRPNLVLDGSSTVSFSVTYSNNSHVEFDDGEGEDAPTTADLLDTITVHLSTDDDLYVINEASVKVYMGDNEVAGAYDPTTDTITVNNVVGNVVIVAEAMTYVQNGLAFQLDCMDRGGQTGHWIDRIGGIDFALGSAVTAADSGVVFDGSANSYGETDSALNHPAYECTVECVFHDGGSLSSAAPVIINPALLSVGLCVLNSSGAGGNRVAVMRMRTQSDALTNSTALVGNSTTEYAMSLNVGGFTNMGSTPVAPQYNTFFTVNEAHTKLTIGRARKSSSDPTQDVAFNGTIQSIRIYHSVLTAEQQYHNWLIDKKRFNLA